MIKHILAVALMIGAVVLAGCDTLDDATSGIRDRFAARNEPRTKTFSSPPRVVYDGVKAAANTMGYRFVRGGPAQGEFEAVSGVAPGELAGTAQQLTMKVRLHATLDGTGTDVSVRFTQILEEDSRDRPGMATEATMRDTPLYEVFFRDIQQALDVRPTAQPIQPRRGCRFKGRGSKQGNTGNRVTGNRRATLLGVIAGPARQSHRGTWVMYITP